MNSTEASKQDEDTQHAVSMLHEGAEAGKVESEAKVSAPWLGIRNEGTSRFLRVYPKMEKISTITATFVPYISLQIDS